MRVRITLRMLVLSAASLAVFAVAGGLHAQEQEQSKPSAATPAWVPRLIPSIQQSARKFSTSST